MTPAQRNQHLAELAEKINKFGPDSKVVESYISSRQDDEEFVKLARLAQNLKRSFSGTSTI